MKEESFYKIASVTSILLFASWFAHERNGREQPRQETPLVTNVCPEVMDFFVPLGEEEEEVYFNALSRNGLEEWQIQRFLSDLDFNILYTKREKP
jgi:hypothetical protein